MEIKLLDLFILVGMSQGLIVGFVILNNQMFQDKTNRYLAYSIMMIAIIGLNEWSSRRNLQDEYYFIDFWGDDVPWVLVFYVPMLFYFVKSLASNFLKNASIWWFCLPFFIFLILNMIIDLDLDFGWIQATFLVENRGIVYFYEYYLALFYNIFLCGLAYYVISQSQVSKKEKAWPRRLWSYTAILIFTWLVLQFTPDSFYEKYGNLDYFLWVGVCMFIFWLLYSGLFHFNLSKNRAGIQEMLHANEKNKNPKTKNQENGNAFPGENIHIQNLLSLMEKENAYRNPDLSRDIVAEKLGISPGYISQLVLTHTQKNFSTFINAYRVEEVKKMLLDPAFDRYDVLAIGLEAGFKSKSAYYNIFKKESGFTPSQYKKRNKS